MKSISWTATDRQLRAFTSILFPLNGWFGDVRRATRDALQRAVAGSTTRFRKPVFPTGRILPMSAYISKRG